MNSLGEKAFIFKGFGGKYAKVVKVKRVSVFYGMFGEGSLGIFRFDVVFVSSDAAGYGILGLAYVGTMAVRSRAGDFVDNIGFFMKRDGIFKRGIECFKFVVGGKGNFKVGKRSSKGFFNFVRQVGDVRKGSEARVNLLGRGCGWGGGASEVVDEFGDNMGGEAIGQEDVSNALFVLVVKIGVRKCESSVYKVFCNVQFSVVRM